jgi:uncharacterized protein (TIGR03790 family)
MKKTILLLTICIAVVSVKAQTVNYNDVAVIINSNSSKSVEIGNYFKEKRNIPNINMVTIQCSTDERVDSAELFSIVRQVGDYLVNNGIDQSINYLVTTKGVPLIFEHANCDSFPENLKCSAIDSELTLLLNHEDQIGVQHGFANPYFDNMDYTFSQEEYNIYLVTRLDGYTVSDVKNLIDRSGPNLKIDKKDAQFIFDLAFATDTNAISPLVQVMEAGNELVSSKGWSSIYSPDNEAFITNESHVLGYFSYIYQPSNKNLNYQWLNGSLAFQGIGETAFTFLEEENTYNDLIIANLIEEGVCGAAGTVVPYFLSQGTVWPEILFDRQTYGIDLMSETNPYFNLAESYFQALKVTSSAHVIVGDPKTSIVLDAFVDGTTIVLQPGSDDGKDASLWSNDNGINHGDRESLTSYTWTYNGDLSLKRSFLAFDFSSIPEETSILNAKLSLFYNPTDPYESFDFHTGENDIFIQRVISEWDEHTIVWNNQPATTTEKQVKLPPSTDSTQDYLNIDVTDLVIEMTDPLTDNNGFMIRMADEVNYYKSVLFASSDHADPDLHPKLEISYLPETVHCTTIKPNADEGKDAALWSNDNGINHGDRESLTAYTWTDNGYLSLKRSFLAFDFSSIPEEASILNAKLSLFYNPTDPYESFDVHTGENDIFIQRIISEWDEHTIVWNNQPAATTEKQVKLTPSIDSTQDYIDIDVTGMVIDMMDPANENNGFMLKMVDEFNYYKSVLFASSDHSDSYLHPEITICWTMNFSSVNDKEVHEPDFDVYPNPNRGVFSIRLPEDNTAEYQISIYNSTGQQITNYGFNNNQIKLSEKGIFVVILSDQYGNYSSRKVIVM